MDAKDAAWFSKNYSVINFSVENDIRSFDDGPYTYQIQGGNSSVSMRVPALAFERLVMNAKIGFDELERARARVDYPNVQAAYDAYLTLLALSTKYDE